MSFVSKLVQIEESEGTERYFWNRLRYEKMVDVGTSCYAEGAYELIPFWLEDGLRLRDRVSMSSRKAGFTVLSTFSTGFQGIRNLHLLKKSW